MYVPRSCINKRKTLTAIVYLLYNSDSALVYFEDEGNVADEIFNAEKVIQTNSQCQGYLDYWRRPYLYGITTFNNLQKIILHLQTVQLHIGIIVAKCIQWNLWEVVLYFRRRLKMY